MAATAAEATAPAEAATKAAAAEAAGTTEAAEAAGAATEATGAATEDTGTSTEATGTLVTAAEPAKPVVGTAIGRPLHGRRTDSRALRDRRWTLETRHARN
jgi:hypothetical protein